MMDRSQPPALKWLRSLFDEGEPLHGRTVITAEEFIAIAREDFAAPDGVDRHAVAALKAEGYQASPPRQAGLRKSGNCGPRAAQICWHSCHPKGSASGLKLKASHSAGALT